MINTALEKDLSRLISNEVLECKLIDFPDEPQKKVIRYFTYDDASFYTAEDCGFALEPNSGVFPRNEDRYHNVDVEELFGMLADYDNQPLRDTAVAALAKADDEDLLMRHLLDRDQNLKARLKKAWGHHIDNEQPAVNPFMVIAHAHGIKFSQFLKENIYKECADYMLSESTDYEDDDDRHLSALPENFFDGLHAVCVESTIAFGDLIPIDEDSSGGKCVVLPSEIETEKEYDWISLCDGYENESLEELYSICDCEELRDGGVRLEWRHDENKQKFGNSTDVVGWGEAFELCRTVLGSTRIDKLDKHRGKVFGRFQAAQWTLDTYNAAMQGEVYLLREATFRQDSDGEWQLDDDECQCGGYIGNWDAEEL